MHISNDWKKDYTKAFNHSIGHGSFGKVVLVRSIKSGQFFAMKEINLKQPILKSSIINRSYALDEGIKLRQLNATQHRNIIKYYRSYLHDESIYWIMEYCDGGTLKDRINLYMKSEKQISEDLIWYWTMHILNGIKYIHNKGIIHRDIKPDNIFIEGKRGVCKLGDFGFAKILVETSITENTSIKYIKFDENEDAQSNKKYSKSRTKPSSTKKHHQLDEIDEDRIAYKFINMSQVGTPSYIAPELRLLIESHLTYCSVETINKSIELCEKYIYKGDIFSFGCILYELIHLKPAFENKFLLPSDQYFKVLTDIGQHEHFINYSSDLKTLTKSCMELDPKYRPNIRQIFNFDLIKNRLNIDYLDAYKMQVIPRLVINKKNGPLEYLKVKLENYFKPISMKSLKFNQNLIVILAYKQINSVPKYKMLTTTLNNFSPFGQKEDILLNENNLGNIIKETANSSQTTQTNVKLGIEFDLDDSEVVDMKFLIYNEYGELLNEINSFILEKSQTGLAQRCLLNFKVNDFLVDEEYDHLYLTTKKYGIMRFKIMENNFYLEDLIFDGQLDLSELYDEQNRVFKYFPTCLSLVENETVFKDSIKTTGKRRLIFNDSCTNRLISIQVDLISTASMHSNFTNTFLKDKALIKCNINGGLTLDKQLGTVKQIVCTQNELICLFDNCGSNIINIYNLKTLQFKRSNQKANLESKNNYSYKNTTFCLTLDSDYFLYSTNGKSIFNLDYVNFKKNNKINPSIRQGENLSHTITWMSILTNSKLVLLTDAIQMENSMLFILKQR